MTSLLGNIKYNKWYGKFKLNLDLSNLDPEELESEDLWSEHLALMPPALLIDRAMEKLLELTSKQKLGKSSLEEDQILVRFRSICAKI